MRFTDTFSFAVPITVAGLSMLVLASCSHRDGAAQIPDEKDYVQADSAGHLMLNGVRQRYWGVIGGFPHVPKFADTDTPEQRAATVKQAYAEVDALIQRLIDLGFNLNRTWEQCGGETYTKGDGSHADLVDYYILRMRERGLRLWGAGINAFRDATPADVDVITDAGSATAWQEALQHNGGKISGTSIARVWDPRLEALNIRQRTQCATHFNQHTQLRWCDDPAFVAWELSNEEWWMSKMVGGQWLKLPAYFQTQLIAQWNGFLAAKYQTQPSLLERWKTLLPGESLTGRSIQLLPIGNDQPQGDFGMDPTARKQFEDARAGVAVPAYGRKDFARARGEDVIEFFLKIQIEHKQREAAAFKALGRSAKLSPLCYDTGIGYEVQSQYLHQHADAVAHDAYVNGTGKPGSNRDIWLSWTELPPMICQDVPWLEHNKIEGKPYFAYETQIQQPAKYRADFPLRVAALASIQDWDIICWHYFAPPTDIATNPQAFTRPTDNTIGGHPQGYHYTFDEVQTAMMRGAGLIWRQQALAPAPHPTTYVYGRKTLLDPQSMDYGKSYGDIGTTMLPTVYQYGCRIRIDANREDDQVTGPVLRREDMDKHNPYTPTKQITFDQVRGNIVYDAPLVTAFTGFLPKVGGSYSFSNGIRLSDVSIDNPPGIYDPIPTSEGYIGFELYSEDGKPLAESKAASLSLVSTSFNTGFTFSKEDFLKYPNSPLAASAQDKRDNGHLPVLVARVAGTITGAAINGMTYDYYDWNMHRIGGGTIHDGTLRIPSDQPIFVVKLRR